MPNVRKQDLVTVELLCRSCEQRFAQWEHQFASHIFRPFQAQRLREPRQQSFAYDEWLLRFAVSLAWRMAVIDVDSFRKESPGLVSSVTKAISTWRNYLLQDHAGPGPYEHHLLFLDVVKSATVDVPDGLHAYMLRGIDASLISTDQAAYAYVKLPGMVFWSGVEPPIVAGWKNTKIDRTGVIGSPQRVEDDVFGWVLFQRAELTASILDTLSDAQQERIAQAIRQQPDRLLKSHSLEAIEADRRWRYRRR